MFSKKAQKRPNSDSISSDFLEGFGNGGSSLEMPSLPSLPSFLFNSSGENSIFKTPEINRHQSRVSNGTPLLAMTPSVEQTCARTPSPERCMTSTPKQVEPEQIQLNDGAQAIKHGIASKDIRTIMNERALFEDSSLQQLSSISKPEELPVRQIGTYTIPMLEEEFERLLAFIREEREKNVQQVTSIIQSMRDQVDRVASALENVLDQRIQKLDQLLQEGIESFEREMETARASEEELRYLRQKISCIVDLHLQTPTKTN